MRRVSDDTEEMVGQDSFLDVVTNIVGILILLVMVVGMRASKAAVSSAADGISIGQPQLREAADEASAYQRAIESEKAVRDLVHRAHDTHEETLLREEERFLLNMLVAQMQQDVDVRRQKLSATDQRDFDVRQRLNEAQLTLDELTREQVALVSQESVVEEIECQPTPLARAVTGREVHLLLADDHLAVVPFDALLEQLKLDVRQNVWRLRDQDQLERMIGPIDGFRLRYWFVKANVVARSETGAMMSGHIPRFSHCYFLPVSTPVGEPATDALMPHSELWQYLQPLHPHGTTVTIWTYPGNYDRLREVKRVIRERGFQIAVRPLPAGTPIGASHTGTESVTE